MEITAQRRFSTRRMSRWRSRRATWQARESLLSWRQILALRHRARCKSQLTKPRRKQPIQNGVIFLWSALSATLSWRKNPVFCALLAIDRSDGWICSCDDNLKAILSRVPVWRVQKTKDRQDRACRDFPCAFVIARSVRPPGSSHRKNNPLYLP